ncbi:MAG: bifunctional folylpolyglutamate synthase/dihydrofolate synthase [Candidatus Glassbacteria bacterium]
MENSSFRDSIKFLYSLQRFGVKLGLDRMGAFLDELGNPHEAYRSIHIAGTNGKGSTSKFLESVLRNSGLKVGLYISPHLLEFGERIRIGQTVIERDYMTQWISTMREKISRLSLTFFEVATALAFSYFRDMGVEFAICEAGMGGRLDATNVLSPCAAVITNIGIDHGQQLGSTKKKIAMEKLGIVKELVPIATGETDHSLLAEHRRVARNNRAPLHVLDERVEIELSECTMSGTRFSYSSPDTMLEGLHTTLIGPHQARNAALAIMALETIRDVIYLREEHIRKGLAEAWLPGRFQVIETPSAKIILDVAHNPSASRALVETLRLVLPGKEAVVVAGMSSDKDTKNTLGPIAPIARKFIVSRPDFSRHERKAQAAQLYDVVRDIHGSVSQVPDIATATSLGLETVDEKSYMLITGSFYTVAEALSFLRSEGIAVNTGREAS